METRYLAVQCENTDVLDAPLSEALEALNIQHMGYSDRLSSLTQMTADAQFAAENAIGRLRMLMPETLLVAVNEILKWVEWRYDNAKDTEDRMWSKKAHAKDGSWEWHQAHGASEQLTNQRIMLETMQLMLIAATEGYEHPRNVID